MSVRDRLADLAAAFLRRVFGRATWTAEEPPPPEQVGGWRQTFKTRLAGIVVDAFRRGKGGPIAPSDAGRVLVIIERQEPFVDGFFADVERGRVTPAQAGARAELYAGAAVEAWEDGAAASWGMPRLSRMPGDGSTACRTRCRCFLEIEEDEGGWDVYWRLAVDAEHCNDCRDQAKAWAPLRVVKEA